MLAKKLAKSMAPKRSKSAYHVFQGLLSPLIDNETVERLSSNVPKKQKFRVKSMCLAIVWKSLLAKDKQLYTDYAQQLKTTNATFDANTFPNLAHDFEQHIPLVERALLQTVAMLEQEGGQGGG